MYQKNFLKYEKFETNTGLTNEDFVLCYFEILLWNRKYILQVKFYYCTIFVVDPVVHLPTTRHFWMQILQHVALAWKLKLSIDPSLKNYLCSCFDLNNLLSFTFCCS